MTKTDAEILEMHQLIGEESELTTFYLIPKSDTKKSDFLLVH